MKRSARRGLGVIAVSVLSVLGTGISASAHSELEKSQPGNGESVRALEEIVLTFSDPQLGVGGIVEVSDGTQSFQEGAPEVNGALLTQELKDLPVGEYDVVWRSVSVDGHPHEGSFSFEVTGEAAGEAGVSAGAAGAGVSEPIEIPEAPQAEELTGQEAAGEEELEQPQDQPQALQESAPVQEERGRGQLLALSAGGLLLLSLAVGGALLRKRHSGV